MKTAKLNKFILLFVAFVISLILAFTCLSTNVNNAFAVSDTVSTYFGGTADISYANGNIKVSANNGETFNIRNKLLLDKFEIKIKVPANATSVSFEFASDSQLKNGNCFGENDFRTSVVNKVNVAINESNLTVDLNGNSSKDNKALAANKELSVKAQVVNGEFTALIDGSSVTSYSGENGEYLVKENNYVPVSFSMSFGVDGDDPVDFEIISVSQNFDDEKYSQTFEIDNSSVKTLAYPRVLLNDSLYNKDGEIYFIDGELNTLSMSAYSIYGDTTSSDLYLEKGDETNGNIYVSSGEKPKSIAFNKKSEGTKDMSFYISSAKYSQIEKVDVKILDLDYIDGNTLPEYVGDNTTSAYKSFVYALENATKENGHYIPLGDYLDIPSLKNLVSYAYGSFENLKYTVYCNTPTDELKTYSSLRIKIDNPGDYTFYVVFKDGKNAMEIPDKENNILETSDFAFKFHIEDDAPISVKAGETGFESNIGYLNTKYSCVPFVIKSESTSPTYKLFYNADVNATKDSDGWVEIIKSSNLTDSYENETFTSDDIKEIAYNGELEFTPTKIGAYMIDCEVSSTLAVRNDSDSIIIKVTDKAKVVKPDNHWLQNNVWSVVFLSIGTLCLIGIIVLLCIKPKDVNDVEED